MSNQSGVEQNIGQLFKKYDDQAEYKKKLFRFFWISGFIAGVLAAVAFALITLYKGSFNHITGGLILPIAEVVLVGYSLLSLGIIAPKQKTHFINSRRSAETLRIHELFYTNSIPIKRSKLHISDHQIPSDVEQLETQVETGYKPGKLSNHPTVLDNLKAFISGQSKYHADDRIKILMRNEHQIELWLKVILILFVVVILGKFIAELIDYMGHTTVFGIKLKYVLYALKFGVIILPPLYAALEGFHFFSEWKRNIKQSQGVKLRYETILKEIERLQEAATIQREQVIIISDKLYQEFHDENQNWYRWYSSKKIEPRV